MYRKDILGYEFEQLTLQMKSDIEGEVVCTLVHALSPERYAKTILYIHGFSDYFFQKELAQESLKHGYNFYALDLRKSGRSLREWQTRANLYDITDYFEDIDAAIAQIRSEVSGSLVINAHSTGGLAALMYLNERSANTCSALVLNSPFLGMNKGFITRNIGIPLVIGLSKWFPKMKINAKFSPRYGESISSRKYGEWDYNEDWKPIAVDSVEVSWLKAIYKAHKKIHQGLNVPCPILVMSSAESVYGRSWSESFLKADAVLNVQHIHKYADKLGKNVVKTTFKGGLHDLILSSAPVRKEVYKAMFLWLSEVIG